MDIHGLFPKPIGFTKLDRDLTRDEIAREFRTVSGLLVDMVRDIEQLTSPAVGNG